jgi:hypothetical protein
MLASKGAALKFTQKPSEERAVLETAMSPTPPLTTIRSSGLPTRNR